MTQNNNRHRIASIDILRGIAITGMILCANIGFNSGLPAWMFHAQTPPPTYAFNPDVPGITWVDLVFPFFLFAMGAAFPLALRKRIGRGDSMWSITGSLVRRWFTLTVFALVLGNAYATWGTERAAYQVYLFFIATWIAMFLSLVKVDRPGVNLAGVALIVMLARIRTVWFGMATDKWACDVIIMILANIALAGGLIWLLTKDNIRLRCLIFLFVAALKAADSYIPEALSFVPDQDRIGWFFRFDYLQYLLIAIPGSIVGDMLLKGRNEGKADRKTAETAAGFIALAGAGVQLWGLFAREVTADFIISLVLAGAYAALTFRQKDTASRTAWIGWGLMLAGIAFDPIDGGITKDHCNLSYLFTTGGMAALVTSFLLMLERNMGMEGRFLAGVGQNPMIAYTVTTFLIGPVLSLCGILPRLDALTVGSPFWGVVRGIFITALMMCMTYLFTKAKTYWKS